MHDEREFQHRLDQIGELIAQLDSGGDVSLREAARTLVQRVMELHGAGLEQMMSIIAQAGEQGGHIVERFNRNDLVRSLLLLHGLHPDDLATRVRSALNTLAPSLRSYGATAELLDATGGVLRIKVEGSLKGCGLSSVKSALEGAIYGAAPDLAGLVIEGLSEPAPPSFVPVTALLNGIRPAPHDSSQP
jgi:NifU-like domain